MHTVIGLAGATLAMLAVLASDASSARDAAVAMMLEPATVAAAAQTACVRRPNDPERPWIGTWTGSDGDGALLTLQITEVDGITDKVRGTLVVAGLTYMVAGRVNAWGEIEAQVELQARYSTIFMVPTLAGTFPFVTVRSSDIYNSVLDGRRFELCGEVAA